MTDHCPTCGAPMTQRSIASHRQYFAAVNEAWRNLPEGMAADFPTAEHLRKYALIKAGFCDIAKLGIGQRIAADTYSIIVNQHGITTVYTAQSQNMRAMGKAEFQRSKQAVLDVLADLIGTSTEDLKSAEAA